MRRSLFSSAAWCLIGLLALLVIASAGHPRFAAAYRQKPIQPVRRADIYGQKPIQIALRERRNLQTGDRGLGIGVQALEQQLVQPLALASGDFDEDGITDVICGYADGGRGLITLHRGHSAAIWPQVGSDLRPQTSDVRRQPAKQSNSSMLDAQPFLVTARVFELNTPPDFLAAGDFDADGHLDIVGAAQGGDLLDWLRGDGRGGFVAGPAVPLTGRVTALSSGDLNHRDGLADLIVGIVGDGGPAVLLFESPQGALHEVMASAHEEALLHRSGASINAVQTSVSGLLPRHQSLALPAPALALAVGQLDEGHEADLVVAAGHHVVMLHGKDQRSSREGSISLVFDHVSLPLPILSLALGDFVWDRKHRTDIAALTEDGVVWVLENRRGIGWDIGNRQYPISHFQSHTAQPNPSTSPMRLVNVRVSNQPTDDLLLLDGAGQQMHIFNASFVTHETSPGKRAGNHESHITTLDMSGTPVDILPLRLNADALDDLVVLQANQSSPVVLLTKPEATFVVTSAGDAGDSNLADGVCNDGTGRCTLRAAIEQANASAGADSIRFNIPVAGIPTIAPSRPLPPITEPLTLDGTTQPAGRVEVNGEAAGFANGLEILSGRCVVRGLVINRFRIDGICILSNGGNIIEGNLLGTNAAGTEDRGNEYSGVRIDDAPGNLIGGTTPAARNVISGNNSAGILIVLGGARDNRIQGNLIGTDVTGHNGLGNSFDGVVIADAPANLIGDTTANGRNIISAHGHAGILIQGEEARGVRVHGNYIGTDITGSVALGKGAGVMIEGGATAATIGGLAARPGLAPGNVIAGNTTGVLITGSRTTDHQIQGNLIGTNAAGTAALQNIIGVLLEDAPGNTVGGTVPTARNVIAAGSSGVQIQGIPASNNRVLGNYIGTDITATAPIGNFIGVYIIRGTRNIIGGATDVTRNILSGNDFGVYIFGNQASGNIVQGNWIGLNITGRAPLPNTFIGLSIDNAPGNFIGGTTPGATNVISGNQETGVFIQGAAATGNQIVGNLIGTDVTGTAAVGNGEAVFIRDANGNMIGGTSSNAGNIISGNRRAGVLITGPTSSGNLVQGNFIGVDVNGRVGLGNLQGITISFAPANLIGGAVGGARNVISGNQRNGIEISNPEAIENRIEGNLIGTDVTGRVAIPNRQHGITSNSAGTLILNNLISGNTATGIQLTNGSNVVQGNLIGTDATGTQDLGNGTDGISVAGSGNLIGDARVGGGNTISGNNRNGIRILRGDGNRIHGNRIGTDVSGANPIGNSFHGILIGEGVGNMVIGGVSESAGNIIAFNGSNGVSLNFAAGAGTAILSNSMFSNGGLAIDLNEDGVTHNQLGGLGPNDLQPFPSLLSVTTSGGNTTLSGSLRSRPNTSYLIQFYANTQCDPSEHGEGERLLGSATVRTNANGEVNFTITIPRAVATNQVVTATATDANNNTSEFCRCVAVTARP